VLIFPQEGRVFETLLIHEASVRSRSPRLHLRSLGNFPRVLQNKLTNIYKGLIPGGTLIPVQSTNSVYQNERKYRKQGSSDDAQSWFGRGARDGIAGDRSSHAVARDTVYERVPEKRATRFWGRRGIRVKPYVHVMLIPVTARRVPVAR